MVENVHTTETMIGVSPAYFISRYGDRFSPHQVAEAMPDIAGLGFRGFQLEVYHQENLQHWSADGARLVRQHARDAGLAATQFVAHFMMASFSTSEHLYSDAAYEQMRQVLDIAAHFDECGLITVPIGPFDAPDGLCAADHRRLVARLTSKVDRLCEIVEASDCQLALEIIPGGLIAGIDGFLQLCERLGSATLGINLDTGHAWAAKENIYLLPSKLGTRIAGTHLCDNLGHENVSFRPGAGSIDWPRMIAALAAVDYGGSYDLEIICPSEEVQSEYRKGLAVIEKLLQPATVAA